MLHSMKQTAPKHLELHSEIRPTAYPGGMMRLRDDLALSEMVVERQHHSLGTAARGHCEPKVRAQKQRAKATCLDEY